MSGSKPRPSKVDLSVKGALLGFTFASDAGGGFLILTSGFEVNNDDTTWKGLVLGFEGLLSLTCSDVGLDVTETRAFFTGRGLSSSSTDMFSLGFFNCCDDWEALPEPFRFATRLAFTLQMKSKFL